jgi:hypothetical protein
MSSFAAGKGNEPVEFYPQKSGLTSPMPVSDLKKRACEPALAYAQAALDAENAKYAAYLKVLSGDKAQIFKKQKMLNSHLYVTHGGKPLRTPADFATADAWYTWYERYNDKGQAYRWEVQGWQFKGDKKVADYTKSGQMNGQLVHGPSPSPLSVRVDD